MVVEEPKRMDLREILAELIGFADGLDGRWGRGGEMRGRGLKDDFLSAAWAA